jgi:hypothetical protein
MIKVIRCTKRKKVRLGPRVWQITWGWLKRPRISSRKWDIGPYSHSERQGHRLRLPRNPFWRHIQWGRRGKRR